MKTDNMKSNINLPGTQPMELMPLSGESTVQLRNALGRFATGVCVLTGRTPGDAKFGMTINSFGSLSLDPPRVTWAIDHSTPDFGRYQSSQSFCVSVLSREQAGVCYAFADDRIERFADLDWPLTASGCPQVPDALACFDCAVEQTLEVGDHTLFIASVRAIGVSEGAPLAFYGGGLQDLVPLADPPEDSQPFSDRYLAALLGRASAALNGAFAATLPDGVKPVHWRVLACLVDSPQTVNSLAEQVLVKQPTLTRILDTMVSSGLVAREEDPDDRRRVVIAATRTGRELGEQLRADALNLEYAQFTEWSVTEIQQLCRLLKRLLPSHTKLTD